MSDYEINPAANVFPLLEGKEFKELVEDIRENGLIVPILLDSEGCIIDGRNRLRACNEAGVKPRFEQWKKDETQNPWRYVWSVNKKRRHLPESQLAQCGVKMIKGSDAWEANQAAASEKRIQKISEGMKGKRNAAKEKGSTSNDVDPIKKPVDRSNFEAERMAKEIGTSPATTSRALAIEKKNPKLAEKVISGEVKAGEAIRQIKKAEVSKKVAELPKGRYRVFYADPPWKYGNSGEGIDQYGPAERHYPAMSIAELCAMDIQSISAPDAVLFMWVTSPFLEDCFKVINAWGFKYKASFVWDKIKHNYGHYNSVRHELLLICTKGSCTPDSKELIDSVVSIERTSEHSEKPEEFRSIIEKLYQHGQKIELFARKNSKGWKTYGNEL